MKIQIFFVLLLSTLVIGCTHNLNQDDGSNEANINELIDSNNQFAFDLYSEVNREDGNVFFSPYSISTALAMTYEGAKGQTAEEMQSVLHITQDDNLRRSSFKKLYDEVNKKDKSYKLSTANALWAQENYPFLQKYIDIVKKNYGGEVTNLDFVGESEKSREIINTWVEDQTNNKIKDLIPSGVLDKFTRMVLTNAIYFKGTWVEQFNPEDTKDEDFTTGSGDKVKVPMMRLTGKDSEFNYGESEDLQILELPYDGEDLSMLILLPKDNLDAIENSLSNKKLSEWKNLLENQRVDIFIPKFKFESKYFMKETLSKMGMPTAFTKDADFSGMDGTKNLLIQEAIHQAFVEVNEEGTEAAASTAIVMGEESERLVIQQFKADHPFIFIIQQKDNGNILFLGKVDNPIN